MSQSCETWICIPKEHPALPGHFPDAAVVPGVVMLDELLWAAERELGRVLRVMGIPQVKFLSPLLPEQHARCALEVEDSRLTFRIECGGRLVARGTLTLAPTQPESACEHAG